MRLRNFYSIFSYAFSNASADRHNAIQTAAYLKAERAGFPPGQDVRFWTEAEREYDEAVRQSFTSPWDHLMYRIGATG